MKRTALLCLIVLTQLALLSIATAQTTVEFSLSNFPAVDDGVYGIRGNVDPLDWDHSLKLTDLDTVKKTMVQFDESVSSIEFKFVIESQGNVLWEGIENRELTLNRRQIESSHRWDIEQPMAIETLPKLSPEELKMDYALVEEMILKVHPGTYRYNSESEIAQALKELSIAFADSLTHGEAYLAISRLLAKIQCDHTYASFFNQNRKLKSVIHWQKNKLPFAFDWIDDKMIVTYSAVEEIEGGNEVRSIQGLPAAQIAQKLLPFVSADGSTDHSRWEKLSVKGYDFRWSAFDVFFPLVFPTMPELMELELYDFKTETTSIVKISTTTLANRWERLVNRYPDFPVTRDKLLDFHIEGEVGVLKLGTFGIMGWKKLEMDYKVFFKEVFQTIQNQGIENLIIDMRGNPGGGDPMAKELFTYLDLDSIIIDDRVGKTRYTSFPPTLKKYCKTWGNPWFFELEPKYTDEDGYYCFPDGAMVREKNVKNSAQFKGDIYWLVDGHNASLAYYTAKSVRKNNLGLLIGQETGGNLGGINGGQILFLQLPSSEIEIDFPVMGDFTVGNQPNKGVSPHFEVRVEASDIAHSIDRPLEFAFSLIRDKTD